jgi:hypothetical protein
LSHQGSEIEHRATKPVELRHYQAIGSPGLELPKSDLYAGTAQVSR